MKKLDYIIIGSIVFALLIIILLMNILSGKESFAIVYHDGVNILEIDLGVDNEYTINGDIGEIVLEVKDGLLHVLEADCPDHTCEKIGWSNKQSRPIICVPNKIYISFVGASEVDVLIG